MDILAQCLQWISQIEFKKFFYFPQWLQRKSTQNMIYQRKKTRKHLSRNSRSLDLFCFDLHFAKSNPNQLLRCYSKNGLFLGIILLEKLLKWDLKLQMKRKLKNGKDSWRISWNFLNRQITISMILLHSQELRQSSPWKKRSQQRKKSWRHHLQFILEMKIGWIQRGVRI